MRVSFRKIMPWLMGALFLLWLYIAYNSTSGYQEILIPSDSKSFTATFSYVSEIIPINEDVLQFALVEEHDVSIAIQLADAENGRVYQVDVVNSMIHTNGYASTENVHAEGLPLELEAGHTYTVQYWAVCNGQSLDTLSFALYGERVSYRWLQVVVLLTVAAGAVGLFGSTHSDKALVPAMLLLWVSVYVLYLLSMPLQLRDEEETAFARAYAISNEMVGQEIEDANGYVFVEDIGLRNSGYLVYDIPFYRFWSHVGTDTDNGVSLTVTYQDDGVRTLRTYADAAAITVARVTGVSYPIVYLAVALLGGFLGVIVLGVILHCCKRVSVRIRILCVALLPSIFSVLQLHSGVVGLFRSFESGYLWLQLDEILHRIILYVNPSDGTSYLITFVPLLVLGLFAWKDAHYQVLSEQAERTLLSAMTFATVVSALLRLAI